MNYFCQSVFCFASLLYPIFFLFFENLLTLWYSDCMKNRRKTPGAGILFVLPLLLSASLGTVPKVIFLLDFVKLPSKPFTHGFDPSTICKNIQFGLGRLQDENAWSKNIVLLLTFPFNYQNRQPRLSFELSPDSVLCKLMLCLLSIFLLLARTFYITLVLPSSSERS